MAYITSHDVADGPRLMNVLLGPMLRNVEFGDGSIESVKWFLDTADQSSNPTLQNIVQAVRHALSSAGSRS